MNEADYKDGHVPPEYKCSKCEATGVKLWRQYQTFANHIALLCFDCAYEDQSEQVMSASKREMITGHFHPSGDSIGWLVPAVPSEETFWGYTSTPEEGVRWWHRLQPEIDAGRKYSERETDNG